MIETFCHADFFTDIIFFLLIQTTNYRHVIYLDVKIDSNTPNDCIILSITSLCKKKMHIDVESISILFCCNLIKTKMQLQCIYRHFWTILSISTSLFALDMTWQIERPLLRDPAIKPVWRSCLGNWWDP